MRESVDMVSRSEFSEFLNSVDKKLFKASKGAQELSDHYPEIHSGPMWHSCTAYLREVVNTVTHPAPSGLRKIHPGHKRHRNAMDLLVTLVEIFTTNTQVSQQAEARIRTEGSISQKGLLPSGPPMTHTLCRYWVQNCLEEMAWTRRLVAPVRFHCFTVLLLWLTVSLGSPSDNQVSLPGETLRSMSCQQQMLRHTLLVTSAICLVDLPDCHASFQNTPLKVTLRSFVLTYSWAYRFSALSLFSAPKSDRNYMPSQYLPYIWKNFIQNSKPVNWTTFSFGDHVLAGT